MELHRTAIAAMGCLFECFVVGDDPDEARAIGAEALETVARLDAQLSHYREDSDISRLNRWAAQDWVRVEPDLFGLLRHCAELTALTSGAFDVAAGALLKAWDFHHGTGRVASECEIQAALLKTGMRHVAFDAERHLVHYTVPGLTLNLGAIGKGYALDRAVETLRFYGVCNGVIHGGRSTIVALGKPPSGDAWEFVIRDPRDRTAPIETVRLRDAALSTSGIYDQFVEVDGVRYGHLLDPRTGRPPQGPLSVSVIAPTATDADALSTAFFVMGAGRAAEFCAERPDIAAVILEEQGPDYTATTEAPLPPLRVTRIGLP